MSFWDQNYAVEGYKYGLSPNAFLVEQASRFPRGAKILLPGDGEGRNGVWLAEQGHRVTSVDSSKVGLEKALALASKQNVSLQTCHADLAEWSPAPDSFDVVVLVYLHLPTAIRTDVHRRLAQSLRPGGRFILEAFHPQQLSFSSGGPKDPEMLYRPADLQSDLAGLIDVVFAWEGETSLDEGPGHQGPAYVTRIIGQKKAIV